MAARLGAAGSHILVHGRDRARAAALIAEIHRGGGTAAFYPADLASLDEVRTLAASIRHDQGHLDVLINNAGIGVGHGDRILSTDGHELRFAVNYLSGFLLTRLLLPCLGRKRPSRIVNVASAGQQAIDFDDVMLARDYSGRRAYCQSKLAQIMFTVDLAEELTGEGVTVNAIHPATYMDTTMVRQDGVRPVSTVAEGGDAIIRLATDPALATTTSLYFDGQRPARAHAHASDISARDRLRTLSFNLTALSSVGPN